MSFLSNMRYIQINTLNLINILSPMVCNIIHVCTHCSSCSKLISFAYIPSKSHLVMHYLTKVRFSKFIFSTILLNITEAVIANRNYFTRQYLDTTQDYSNFLFSESFSSSSYFACVSSCMEITAPPYSILFNYQYCLCQTKTCFHPTVVPEGNVRFVLFYSGGKDPNKYKNDSPNNGIFRPWKHILS